MKHVAILAAIVLFTPRAALAAHPTPEDLALMRSPADAQISPDGSRIAFTLAGATFDSTAKPKDGDDKAGWKRTRQLWVVTVATRETRELTHATEPASSPRWSPDGRTLVFVRKSGTAPVIHLLPADGGEATQLKTGDLEPGNVAWSPDGRTLSFTAEDPQSDAEKAAKWKTGGAIAWGEEYRPARLYVMDAKGGTPRAVTGREFNVVEYAWAPDSRRFALATSRNADPYEASGLRSVRVVGLDGRTQRAFTLAPSDYEGLVWSPDGSRLALLGLHDGLSNLNAVMLAEPATGTVRNLAPDKDHTFAALTWSGDSRSVIVLERARTETRLVRFPLGGTPEPLPPLSVVVTSALSRDAAGRRLAFLSSTDRTPDEVSAYDIEGGALHVATALNPQVAAWSLGRQELVHWTNAEGTALEGLLTVPTVKSGAKPPLVVYPHGGPDDVTSQRFSGFVQFLAARGYAVFRPNYRGGTGYGFAHYAANRNRFGEIEQADIESGVDALVKTGKVDGARLFYGGWSWGGYLTAWTIGHVQRYRAAVVGAGVSDVALSYSLSDINHGVAAQWEYQGDPWRQQEHFDRTSPIRYAKEIKTPTLILHGQSDGRVPFDASIELWRALSDMGCPVRFYAYPREDHGFVEPAHNIHRFRAWADWYDSHGGVR